MADPQHDCEFPEVEILDDDYEHLNKGDRILAPCSCGERPLDALALSDMHLREAHAAIVQMEPTRPLYHWAPTARRGQIIRYGLRPRMRPTVTIGDHDTYRAPYVCFGDTPSWAWALSGEMSFAPAGSWDLWQSLLDRMTDPVIIAAEHRPSGIYEVRVEHRVFKRDLWFVGSRVR